MISCKWLPICTHLPEICSHRGFNGGHRTTSSGRNKIKQNQTDFIFTRDCWGTERMWKIGNSIHAESVMILLLYRTELDYCFSLGKAKTHLQTWVLLQDSWIYIPQPRESFMSLPFLSSHFYPTPQVLSSIFQKRKRNSKCGGTW